MTRLMTALGAAVLFASAAALSFGLPAPKVAIAADAVPDKAAIEKIVRDYLLSHPELIVELQAAYDQKAELQRNAQMSSALKSNADAIFKHSETPSVNAAASDVTVVEFFDYNCGYCRRFWVVNRIAFHAVTYHLKTLVTFTHRFDFPIESIIAIEPK